MTDQEKPSMDNWDNYVDTWLKAIHFKKFPDEVYVTGVKSDLNQDDKAIILLDVQYDGKKFKKQLNTTDIRKLKELGITKPSDLKLKGLIFEKVRVYDPSQRKQVDSISVSGIK